MNLVHKITAMALLGTLLTGCAGMSTRQKNAAAGAAVGGVAGAVLTHGSAFGTVGGAAIGGIIGHGVDDLIGSNDKGNRKK
jgi:osmotically inducible lipoprotein OsmB